MIEFDAGLEGLHRSPALASFSLVCSLVIIVLHNIAASTIMDRLMHRGALLQFDGKSYRLKEAASRLALGKTEE
jgi:hypothetical protein